VNTGFSILVTPRSPFFSCQGLFSTGAGIAFDDSSLLKAEMSLVKHGFKLAIFFPNCSLEYLSLFFLSGIGFIS